MNKRHITTKDIFRVVPMSDSLRQKLLSSYDTLDPDAKFELEQKMWDRFDAWARPIQERCSQRVHAEIDQGIRERPEDLAATTNQEFLYDVFDIVDQEIAREWEENPNRGEWREKWKMEGFNDKIWQVAFSPNGRTLASAGGNDGTIRFWDVHTGQEIRRLEGHTATSVAFSPDGHLLVSGSNKTICLWDTTTKGKEPQCLGGHTDWVQKVAFNPDGRIIASGCDDGTIRLWDVPNGREIKRFEIQRTKHPDADFLDAKGRVVRRTYSYEGNPTSVAFSPDGRIVAWGSDDNRICLWNISGSSVLQRLTSSLRTFKGDWYFVNSVAFSPDGRILASGDDKSVHIWDVINGREIRKLEGHRKNIASVAFSPNGHVLATGGGLHDGTVRFWDWSNGKCLKVLDSDEVHSIAFSPNGRYLASGSERLSGWVRIWQIEID